MCIVLLQFSDNTSQSSEFMPSHKEWFKRGIDNSVFLVIDSLKPTNITEKGGGGIIAHNTSLEKLQQPVNNDPFVIENVVTAQVLEISPNQVDVPLSFLLDEQNFQGTTYE